jgi:hypothetical protein
MRNLFLVLLLVLASCQTSNSTSSIEIDLVMDGYTSPSDLFEHVQELSANVYKGRLAGTDENLKAGEYIYNYFESNNLTVEYQYYDQPVYDNDIISLTVDGKELIPYEDYYVMKRYLLEENYQLSIVSNIEDGFGNIVAFDYKPDEAIISELKAVNAAGFIYLYDERPNFLKSTYIPEDYYYDTLDLIEIRISPDRIDSVLNMKSLELSYQGRLITKSVPNILGYVEGSTNETLVIGAHFDHVGYTEDDYFPGALDNASGVALLLELSDLLSQLESKPNKNILLIALNGEEEYLFGATAYVSSPVFELDGTQMINLDMVGSRDEVPLIISSLEGTSSTFRQSMIELGETLGYEIYEYSSYNSDHKIFGYAGVENFVLSHPDLDGIHRYEDTIDNYSEERAYDVLELLVEFVEENAINE